MAGTWSKEERVVMQLRSEAKVTEELSGTPADAVYDALLQK